MSDSFGLWLTHDKLEEPPPKSNVPTAPTRTGSSQTVREGFTTKPRRSRGRSYKALALRAGYCPGTGAIEIKTECSKLPDDAGDNSFHRFRSNPERRQPLLLPLWPHKWSPHAAGRTSRGHHRAFESQRSCSERPGAGLRQLRRAFCSGQSAN